MNNDSGSKGSMIGSIIVVIILIVGAIYIFTSKTAITPTTPVNNPDNGTSTALANPPAPSDDINAIETDANTVDVSNLGTDNTTKLEQAVKAQ